MLHDARRNGAQLLIARNRKAAFLWGFALVFAAVVVAMTAVLLRDGSPQGWPPAAIALVMAVFWVAALGLGLYVSGKSCTSARLSSDSEVVLARRYPFRSTVSSFAPVELAPVQVVEDADDEGNPYFYARLVLPDGSEFDLFEGHDRASCEEIGRRFDTAVRPPNESVGPTASGLD